MEGFDPPPILAPPVNIAQPETEHSHIPPPGPPGWAQQSAMAELRSGWANTQCGGGAGSDEVVEQLKALAATYLTVRPRL